ncbi:MAG: response regulator transcription factor [Planctomycetota bacterium]
MTTQTDTKTVLLVDDDPDFLLQMRVRLEEAGYHVRPAQSQADAEQSLAEQKPDIAVVDLMMENVDTGFALCHHIKQADPSIPIIMVSAVTSETGLEFDAGTEEERAWVKADAMLAKPIRFEQLAQQINRLLKVQ